MHNHYFNQRCNRSPYSITTQRHNKVQQQFSSSNTCKNKDISKLNGYRKIRYENVSEMLTPPDDRQFNYHMSNIDSINERISGLLSFVGNKYSQKSNQVKQFFEERKIKQQREYENKQDGQNLKENVYCEIPKNNTGQPMIKQMKSGVQKTQSRNTTPSKLKSVTNSPIKILKNSKRQNQLNSLGSQNSKNMSPQRFSYLKQFQAYQNYQMSPLKLQKPLILQNSRTSKFNDRLAIYQVKQQSSQYTSKQTEMRKNCSSQKSYKIQFKYVEDQQDKNIQKDQQIKEIDNHKHIDSENIKIKIQNKQRQVNQSFCEQVSVPIQPTFSTKEDFQLRLYPCDIGPVNFKEYISNHLLIMSIIDTTIFKQKQAIAKIAFQEYKKIENVKKQFCQQIFEGSLNIIRVLIQKGINIGILQRTRSVKQIRQILKLDDIDVQKVSEESSENIESLVDTFLSNFMLGQKYWNNKLHKVITFNQLDKSKFEPSEIDLQNKGYFRVQDLTCLINIYANDLTQLQQQTRYRQFVPIGYQNKKKLKNKDVLPMFNRFYKRMRVYYANSDFGPVSNTTVINNGGISYECFMDKLL